MQYFNSVIAFKNKKGNFAFAFLMTNITVSKIIQTFKSQTAKFPFQPYRPRRLEQNLKKQKQNTPSSFRAFALSLPKLVPSITKY